MAASFEAQLEDLEKNYKELEETVTGVKNELTEVENQLENARLRGIKDRLRTMREKLLDRIYLLQKQMMSVMQARLDLQRLTEERMRSLSSKFDVQNMNTRGL